MFLKRKIPYLLIAVWMCLALIGCAPKKADRVPTTAYDIQIIKATTAAAQTTEPQTETTAKATEPETTRAQKETTAKATEPETTVKATEPETTRAPKETTQAATTAAVIDKNGTYTSKEDVALYIHTYNKLPKNYITKSEAEDLGWVSSKGNLDRVAPGKSIGGDYFGNREGLLPKKSGRKYTECDIDFEGGYRNSKRIIFSNDGLIFYTEDHYETFERLY